MSMGGARVREPGCPPWTVKTRLHNGLRNLRGVMSMAEGEVELSKEMRDARATLGDWLTGNE
jgi:hypothetical protein